MKKKSNGTAHGPTTTNDLHLNGRWTDAAELGHRTMSRSVLLDEGPSPFPTRKTHSTGLSGFFFWKNAVSSAVTFRRVPFRFPSSIEWIEWSGLFFFLSFHFVRDASEKAFLFSLHVTAFLHSFQVDSSKSDVSSKQFFICALSKFSC